MDRPQTRLENIRQQKNSGDNVYRFLFGITMQNHGDYNYTGDNYTQTIFLEDYEMVHPMAELVCCASI